MHDRNNNINKTAKKAVAFLFLILLVAVPIVLNGGPRI